MLRMMPRCLASSASFGRCSLNRSPGTEVAISLEGPPFLWPGLRSQVSVWLGPPDIHRTMHALAGFLPAAAASRGSHGPAAAPKALARLKPTKSRPLYSRAFMRPSPKNGTTDYTDNTDKKHIDHLPASCVLVLSFFLYLCYPCNPWFVLWTKDEFRTVEQRPKDIRIRLPLGLTVVR